MVTIWLLLLLLLLFVWPVGGIFKFLLRAKYKALQQRRKKDKNVRTHTGRRHTKEKNYRNNGINEKKKSNEAITAESFTISNRSGALLCVCVAVLCVCVQANRCLSSICCCRWFDLLWHFFIFIPRIWPSLSSWTEMTWPRLLFSICDTIQFFFQFWWWRCCCGYGCCYIYGFGAAMTLPGRWLCGLIHILLVAAFLLFGIFFVFFFSSTCWRIVSSNFG